MKILVTSIGTRGDVEPLIATAEILNENGHDVICAFSEQFRREVEKANIPFVSLGPEFMDVMNSKYAKTVFGGGPLSLHTLYANIRLLLLLKKTEKTTIKSQFHAVEKVNPDFIVHNRMAVYPFLWEWEHPGKTVLLTFSPYVLHYVHGHPHIYFYKNYGSYINRLTYKWAVRIAAESVQTAMNHLKIKRKISKKEIKKRILSIRTMYTISNSLFQKPEYWDESLAVMGFFERRKASDWNPPSEIIEFLSKHKKVLLISLGSMINPRPVQKTKIFTDILEENKIPAIIVTASGGLVRPATYNRDLLYFITSIPYNWLLPRVYGVVHHGGSGTVHISLKHGCASLAIPHFIDQFIWNKIIHEKRLGPKGIKINKIKKSNLEPLILDLFNNPEYKQNAEKVALQMKEECSEERLCEFIVGEQL